MEEADWGCGDMGCDARRLHGVRMTEEVVAEVCRECGVSVVETGGGVQNIYNIY